MAENTPQNEPLIQGASNTPVTSGVRFDAAAPAKTKSKFFTGKRLSRNIVMIVAVGIAISALFAFILVNGNKNPALVAKAEKAKKDKEQITQQSQKLTSESVHSMLAEKELQALADKSAKQKAAEDALAKIKANDPMANADYPADSLSKVDQYEKEKLRAQVFGGTKEKAPKSLVAYEEGSGGVLGFGGNKMTEVQDYIQEVGEQSKKDKEERDAREAAVRNSNKGEMPANGVDRNDQWRASQAQINQVIDTSEALQPQLPPSKYILSEGNTIEFVLLTAIDSQLPGKICAKTIADVYDSINGNYLLIPKTTMACGSYNTDVGGGQDRVFIAFSRLIFPNGSSMQIGSMTGSDPQGRAGIGGEVFSNFWKQLGTSLLIAGVSSAVEPRNSSVTNNYGSAGVSSAAGQVLVDTSKANLERYAQFKPKITVEAGSKITVVVAKDMELNPAIVRNPLKFK